MSNDPFDPAGGWAPDWAPSPELEAMLLEGLASDDPSVVHEALDGFHESASLKLALAAFDAARREGLPTPIRCEAVQAPEAALEASTDPRAADLATPFDESELERISFELRALVEDESLPTVVRCQALETGALAGGDWQESMVRRAWKSASADWRFAAVVAMGAVPGFEEELAQALDDPDDEVRQEAAVSIGNRRLGSLADRLLDIAGDPDESFVVRSSALEGIALLGPSVAPPRSAGVLLALIEDGPEDLASLAHVVLVRLGLDEAPADLSDLDLE